MPDPSCLPGAGLAARPNSWVADSLAVLPGVLRRTCVHAPEIGSGVLAGAGVPARCRPRARGLALAQPDVPRDVRLRGAPARPARDRLARVAAHARPRLLGGRPRAVDGDGVPRPPLRAPRRLPGRPALAEPRAAPAVRRRSRRPSR